MKLTGLPKLEPFRLLPMIIPPMAPPIASPIMRTIDTPIRQLLTGRKVDAALKALTARRAALRPNATRHNLKKLRLKVENAC